MSTRAGGVTLLVFTTLFPNAAQPQRGLFVERRLRKLMDSGGLSSVVVAPVPWFPFRHPRFGRFSVYAAVPRVETRGNLQIHHPRYFGVPGLSQYLAPFFMFLGAWLLCRRLIRQRDVDVVDAHYLYPDAAAAALIAWLSRKPLVATARGTDLNVVPENRFCRYLIRRVWQRSTVVITVSEALKSRATALGLNDGKAVVLRNGVDTDVFSPRETCGARKRLGLPEKGAVLLSVGNLVSNKGHDLVVEALQSIPAAHLVIVGEGEERRSLEQQISDLGLTGRVRLAGSVDSDTLIEFYAAADALVLASATEGMPNVVLEALSCGLPVISTDCGGVREIIRDPLLGVILERRSAGAIAAGIEVVLSNPGAHSSEAIRDAARQFDWAGIVERQRHLYASVSGGDLPPAAIRT